MYVAGGNRTGRGLLIRHNRFPLSPDPANVLFGNRAPLSLRMHADDQRRDSGPVIRNIL